jgi:hypothetical protein
MKQFMTSGILRKMLILAALTCALVFVHFSDNIVTAKQTICCDQCAAIEEECLAHLGEYKNLQQCMDLNGGSGCATCNPLCQGCMPNCP